MRVISELRKKPGLTLKRIFILFIANIIGLYLISYGWDFTPGRFSDVIVFIIFISIANSILWPILTRILMPFLVLTFGIGSLILNGLIFSFFAPLFDICIEGWGIILAPLAIALITTILSTVLTIEDDGSYYRAVLRDAQRKRKDNVKDYPGLIIVEIDGLSYEVLCEAVENGHMPNIKAMIDSKSHTLKKWETDLSQESSMETMKISLHSDGLKNKMTIK